MKEARGLFLMLRHESSLSTREAEAAGPDQRGLLRIFTCGSVDDGKSTLIGRLLYDSELVLND
jgi:bifunctional enzyme CysN/CysC